MKALLLLLTMFLLSVLAFGQSQSSGVRDGSTWKNSSGTKKVTIHLTVQTNGNIGVEYTDQDGKTGSTSSGTPVPGTNTVKESPSVKVGNDFYRIRDGKVQWLNPQGAWIPMYEPGFVEVFAPGDPTVGTLPY